MHFCFLEQLHSYNDCNRQEEAGYENDTGHRLQSGYRARDRRNDVGARVRGHRRRPQRGEVGGGTDGASEGSWAWDTGETWGYANWGNGEPNDSRNNEDAMEMISSTGKWNDIPTTHNRPYVVEFEPPEDWRPAD